MITPLSISADDVAAVAVVTVPGADTDDESTYSCDIPDWLQQCLDGVQDPDPAVNNDRQLIKNAFQFAYDLHGDQKRKSGEPYICHPVAVAGLLRDLGGGAEMIAAGFLHDVVEDTEITIDEIGSRFGQETAHLVFLIQLLVLIFYSTCLKKIPVSCR